MEMTKKEEKKSELEKRIEELEKEKRRDGLLGQATMEEAYNRITELEEENKKLRKEKGNIRQRLVALEKKLETLSRVKENKELIKENKNLNIKVASLEGEIKGLNSVIDKLREELSAYDREYFDEDKKAKNIFMEEDTLQELRDIGKI